MPLHPVGLKLSRMLKRRQQATLLCSLVTYFTVSGAREGGVCAPPSPSQARRTGDVCLRGAWVSVGFVWVIY